MDFEAVKAWLAQWTAGRVKACRAKGILGLLLAPFALAGTTTGIYWLCRLFLHDRSGDLGDATTCIWISLAAIPLMFLGNRLVPRRNLMEERMSGDATDLALAHSRVGRAEVIVYLLLWILFTGPRLVDWALASFRAAREWRQQDTHGCAAALWLLGSRHKKVPFEDFQQELPWLDMAAALPELMRIPGVLHLKTPPVGLSLTDELRQAVRTGGRLEI